MAFNYTKSAATAKKLLTNFGQDLTFTKASVSGGQDQFGNPLPGTTELTVTGKGVALEYKRAEIDGTNIVMGDQKLILEATADAPEIEMTVPIQGKTFRVMDVMPLEPAGTTVIYTLQVRI